MSQIENNDQIIIKELRAEIEGLKFEVSHYRDKYTEALLEHHKFIQAIRDVMLVDKLETLQTPVKGDK